MEVKFVLLAIVFIGVNPYDIHVETDKDLRLWRIQGDYFYGSDLPSSVSLLLSPNHLLHSTALGKRRKGVWFARHPAKLSFSYSLSHALFAQARVVFVSSSPLLLLSNNEEVGKFWSEGAQWCDAVVTLPLQTKFTLEVETSQPGDFFFLDKIFLGGFSNITDISNAVLNPCATHPPTPPRETPPSEGPTYESYNETTMTSTSSESSTEPTTDKSDPTSEANLIKQDQGD